MSSNIAALKTARGSVNPAGEADFSAISNVQLIDSYNKYYSTISTNWLMGAANVKNSGPLTPYMYSRTSNVGGYDTSAKAVANFSIANFGGNSCMPYWARDTFGSLDRAVGMDSAWLNATFVPLTPGQQPTYPNASVDPTQPAVFTYPSGTGAESCTDVSPAVNTPIVFCINFLSGAVSRFNMTATSPVFTAF